MNKINVRQWRSINTILIATGLSMPWIMFHFDNYQPRIPAQSPPVGWSFFFSLWKVVLSDFMAYRFELPMLLFLAIGFGGVLLVLYLIFNVYCVVQNREQKKNKITSFTLIGLIASLSFLVFFAEATPFLGYWLSNLGILSSAMLEWINR